MGIVLEVCKMLALFVILFCGRYGVEGRGLQRQRLDINRLYKLINKDVDDLSKLNVHRNALAELIVNDVGRDLYTEQSYGRYKLMEAMDPMETSMETMQTTLAQVVTDIANIKNQLKEMKEHSQGDYAGTTFF